jgi:hypothetical protein
VGSAAAAWLRVAIKLCFGTRPAQIGRSFSRQMGYADGREWAVVLRTNQLAHNGTPPPRRKVMTQLSARGEMARDGALRALKGLKASNSVFHGLDSFRGVSLPIRALARDSQRLPGAV